MKKGILGFPLVELLDRLLTSFEDFPVAQKLMNSTNATSLFSQLRWLEPQIAVRQQRRSRASSRNSHDLIFTTRTVRLIVICHAFVLPPNICAIHFLRPCHHPFKLQPIGMVLSLEMSSFSESLQSVGESRRSMAQFPWPFRQTGTNRDKQGQTDTNGDK